MAPVKAPRRWPKNSLSNSSSGMAAQLTETNGPRARGDFLAHAWRARDEDAAACRRDALQRGADGVDRHRAAMELVLVPDLQPQRLVLAPQPLGLGRTVNEIDQPLGLERLFDEVDRPLPHRRDGRVEIAVARNHQHRQR
jgi:hypothetical protein